MMVTVESELGKFSGLTGLTSGSGTKDSDEMSERLKSLTVSLLKLEEDREYLKKENEELKVRARGREGSVCKTCKFLCARKCTACRCFV